MAVAPHLHFKTGLESLARIFLGGLFIVSGVGKILSPNDAANLVERLLPLNPTIDVWAVEGLSVLEIVIGALFLSGRKRVLAAFISSCILLAAIPVGVVLLRDPIPCGCFGKLIESQTDEFFIVRNVTLFLLSIFVLRASIHRESNDGQSTEHKTVSA